LCFAATVPPVPEKISHAIDFHELKWDDPFFWLREKTNEKVISHLNAENDYTEAMMAHTKDLQAQLYKELVGRIKETDTSAPYPYGPYIY
jgi:oligopeptidase B